MVVNHIGVFFCFSRTLQNVTLERGKSAVSSDVTSLFTSVPIIGSLDVLQVNQWHLEHIFPLGTSDIITSVKLCLISIFFTINHVLCRQADGAAMGFPASPIVANLFLHSTESRALTTFHTPPQIYVRYVDDTFAVIKYEHIDEYLHCFEGQSNQVKFTMETKTQSAMGFLDSQLTVNNSYSLTVGIHRKSKHSNGYLNLNLAHPQCAKLALISSLASRVDKPCRREIQHLRVCPSG